MNSSGRRRDHRPSARLVMISGPIASGKSTLSTEIAGLLRSEGWSVALTALDTVAEMARPTLPDWNWAHDIHAQLVGAWLATGIDLVIDEGTSSPTEVQQVLDRVPTGVTVFHVVLTADYAASLARAEADPGRGRGLSKDPDFLRTDHDTYTGHLPDLPCNVRVHVEGRAPTEMAEELLDHLF